MSFKTFLKLVEIQTKLASLFPFLLGTLFASVYFKQFNLINTLLFFAGMLIFDMTTTAINNFMDYQKAKNAGYKDNVNVIGQEKIPEKLVRMLIWVMLLVAAVLGIILTWRTDILVLLMGGICFFIGVFYTFGPVPLSRMPLGELFSGVTMGFGIFFISVYVNLTEGTLLAFEFLPNNQFILSGNYLEIVTVLLVSLPSVFTIANIMLANNICDLEEDISNHRYTLPFYLGRKLAIQLFDFLIYFSYVVIIVAVIFGVYHPIMLGTLVSFIPVKKNLAIFSKKQVKSETFVISIKNLILVNGSQVLFLALSLLF